MEIKKFLKNKVVIVVAAIVIFSILISSGILIGSNLSMQSKTTKIGFEDMGELVTQVAHITQVQDSKENRDFFNLFGIPFTESRQIFSYDIDVEASLDFSKITYNPIEEQKRIKMVIPHATVHSVTIDEKSLQVFLDDESLFSRIDLKEHNAAQLKMKDQAKKDAIENGLLEKADDHAKVLLKGMIKSNPDYKEYDVDFDYIG